MSSHHFVKEGQEPALLITDSISHELIEPLLEWAPLVMVFDRCLDQILQSRIKVDVVIAITESDTHLADSLSHQMPVEILTCRPGENPLAKGLNFLAASKQVALNIVSDHPLDMISEIDRHHVSMDISIITSTIRWSFIASGEFKKWVQSGSKFKVKGNPAVKVYLNERNDGFISSQNDAMMTKIDVQKDGIVSICSESGFWVGERY